MAIEVLVNFSRGCVEYNPDEIGSMLMVVYVLDLRRFPSTKAFELALGWKWGNVLNYGNHVQVNRKIVEEEVRQVDTELAWLIATQSRMFHGLVLATAPKEEMKVEVCLRLGEKRYPEA